MNRTTYYRLRHNIRASGWSWNGGTKFIHQDSEYAHKSFALRDAVPKFSDAGVVAGTLRSLYDKPKKLDYDNPDSGQHMPLYLEWAQVKDRKLERTKVWWQNYIRSNVRNDIAIFTEQLTKI